MMLDGVKVQLKTIEANGILIHTAMAGSGHPILLLHGWPFNWYVWHRVIPGLTRAGYRVIAPDLRGIGGSSRAETGYDLRTLALDAAALLGSLRVTQAAVVGFDLGVQPAFMFAMIYPGLVQRLVLTEALLGKLPGAEAFLKAGPPWWFGFHAASGLAENALVGNEDAYLNWFYENSTVQKLSEESRAQYVHAYTGRDALRGGFEHYRAFSTDALQIAETLKKGPLKQPTLILGGGVVGDAPYQQLKPFAVDLRYERIASCGHVTPQEQPEEFLAHLLSFLG